jgi:hypothetical protein
LIGALFSARKPLHTPLIPAQAGIQCDDFRLGNLSPWTPAFAGVSGRKSVRFNVMAGHSRPKDGVLSHAYVPAIHFLPVENHERRRGCPA